MIKDVFARIFLLKEDKLSRHQVRVVCGDGSTRWVETNVQFELGNDGKTRTVLVVQDISERSSSRRILRRFHSRMAPLGWATDAPFDQMLDRSWRGDLRDGGEMALLLLDIDYFRKQFNDLRRAIKQSRGRLPADSRKMRKPVRARRPDDMACRYGGENLPSSSVRPSQVPHIDIAEEIRSSIAALGVPHEASKCSRYLTVSIGVATAVAAGGSIRMPESLLQAADHALTKQKRVGEIGWKPRS